VLCFKKNKPLKESKLKIFFKIIIKAKSMLALLAKKNKVKSQNLKKATKLMERKEDKRKYLQSK
jgi:hypothetical protein